MAPHFIIRIAANNQLTGLIPTEVASLEGMSTLDLCKYGTSGVYSPTVDSEPLLMLLHYLFCSIEAGNMLTGGIPTDLASMQELEFLFLCRYHKMLDLV